MGLASPALSRPWSVPMKPTLLHTHPALTPPAPSSPRWHLLMTWNLFHTHVVWYRATLVTCPGTSAFLRGRQRPLVEHLSPCTARDLSSLITGQGNQGDLVWTDLLSPPKSPRKFPQSQPGLHTRSLWGPGLEVLKAAGDGGIRTHPRGERDTGLGAESSVPTQPPPPASGPWPATGLSASISCLQMGC